LLGLRGFPLWRVHRPRTSSSESFGPFAEKYLTPAHTLLDSTRNRAAPNFFQELVPMKNITVCVSDRVHHEIRVWAARRDTSLSKIVQDFLEDLPNLDTARDFPISPFEEKDRRNTRALREQDNSSAGTVELRETAPNSRSDNTASSTVPQAQDFVEPFSSGSEPSIPTPA
jgi:hypothetical protein